MGECQMCGGPLNAAPERDEESAPEITPDDPVEELWGTWRGHVSTRALNIIRRDGIKTVRDLTRRTAAQLADIRNLGEGSLAEVQRVLAANGLHLAGEGLPRRAEKGAASSGWLDGMKAHLEKDGARYVHPFLLWLEGEEVLLGHVAHGRVVSSGALAHDRARELAAELLTCADLAEAEARTLPEGAR